MELKNSAFAMQISRKEEAVPLPFFFAHLCLWVNSFPIVVLEDL